MSVTPQLVKDFMTPNPITIELHESVEAAVKRMEEHQISGLPVVDEAGRAVGIVSEGDLLVRESPLQPPLYMTLLGSIIYFESPTQFHQHMKKAFGMSVQDIMTAKPVTIHPDASLADAAHLMLEKRVNRLPVVDEAQKLVGILTRHDLICALKPQLLATNDST
ncbi:MAG: CBS domain-containing protein [Thermosynechococcaceae cyanobacterium]